jgi:hypothetical protein
MQNSLNLLYRSEDAWLNIKAKHYTVIKIYWRYLLFMALIPVASAYIGSVYIGWNISNEATSRLTSSSAISIAISAYIGMLLSAYVLAHLIYWMAKTYASKAKLEDCFALVVYASLPLFLASVVTVYPILWFDTLVILGALAMSVRLLFIGTPIMMEVETDRGFLFANSILAVSMVLSVAAIVISVIFWGLGIGPEFSY